MAISAERFKFLDKETNVATKEFIELVDNQIYNSVSEVVDTALEAAKDAEKLLDKVAESMNELKDMVMSGLEAVGEAIKSALNAAIDAISKLELPGIIKDLFKTLKELDLSGVKDFVKDLLHVGASFLCNNLDFLKMFMLGYALNGNILGGLLTALLMSWLDRFCKGFSKEDVATSSPTEKLEMMIPPKGIDMTPTNTFSNFTNTYADYIKASSPINLANAPTSSQFLDDIIAGSVSSSINTLRSAEITTTQKKSYMDTITGALSTFNQGTQEFANLLNAKGQLAGIPLISVERRETQMNFSNLSDQLGSMAKNLIKVDLNSVNKFSFNELEKGLFNKVTEFKNNSQSNRDLHTRGLSSGSFDNFDFNNLLPSLSDEERTYLSNQPGSGTAHRLHDMHPTTSVFLMT
jgi:hypothetical protein